MEWYEELDFDENPFDTDPRRFHDKLVGLNEVLDDIFYRISAGSMVFIEGKKGYGKTSLFWNVIKKYKGQGRIIYVDCERIDRDLNIENLLINKQGIFGKLFKTKPRNMILLLDNISELSKKNSERVKYFFDQGYIHTVLFTGESFAKANFSASLLDRIGSRVIKLKELDKYQAIALIRNRVPETEIISDDIIETIFKLSGKTPLTLLENCEKLFSHVIESNEDKITNKHLNIIGG